MKISLIFKFNGTLNDYYQKEITTKKLDYKSAIKFILKENHNLCGSFHKELSSLNIESQIIFSNFEFLNHVWCKENSKLFESNESVLKNQITSFNPNIVYCGSYFELFDTLLPYLKKEIGCKVYTWIACPLPKDLYLKSIDKIFTSLPSYQKLFSSMGIKAEETIVGFDSSRKLESEKKYDVGFIGGINGVLLGGKYHTYRTEILKFLSKKIEIHKWGYGYLTDNKIKNTIKVLINGKALYNNYHGEVWGDRMLNTLASFRIGLNVHAEVAGDYAVNNRIFETTGVGTLLLTDKKSYLSKYFEPEKEVVTFNSKQDCLHQIKKITKAPEKYSDIALNGFNKTQTTYQFKNYVKKVTI